MADGNDIPSGNYRLELGSSFANGDRRSAPATSFHTLRYDFKPGSVSNDSETYIAYNKNGDVHVAVPNEGDNLNVFKGSKKDAKPKECLLFFDKRTNTVRLEKITANINVKKTRDLDPSAEAALRNGIERLRTTSSSSSSRIVESAPVAVETRSRKDSSSSSSSSSGSGSDSSSDDDSDDNKNDASSGSDDESRLVGMLSAPSNGPANNIAPKMAPIAPQMESFNNMPKLETSSNRNNSKYGLNLSDSSDTDED